MGDPRIFALSAARADSSATDIAGALTTAAGIFPPTDEKRLVLLSDGVETQNNALDELPALADAGVRVFTAAPPPSAVARVALTGLEAPSAVHAQTSFALHLDIASESSHPVDAHIRLYDDGGAIGGRQVRLRPGINRFELPYRIDAPGAYILRAAVHVEPGMALVNGSAEVARATPFHRRQCRTSRTVFTSQRLPRLSGGDHRQRERQCPRTRSPVRAQSLRRRLRRRADRHR
jgi:hypothetical protein